MTITCKTCGKQFKEKGDKEEMEIHFDFYELIKHTKEIQHHIYKIEGLKMELSVG